MKINAVDFVAYALAAVGGGYVWGADGQRCSLAVRKELAGRLNPATSQDMISKILGLCAKWDGKYIWDCSGLFRGALRKLLAYKSGGATTIYKTWCADKGTTGVMGGMPDMPGIALFRGTPSNMAHIGLYVGGGMVVHAKGSAYGVIHEPMANYPWSHWGKLIDVEYGDTPSNPPPSAEDVLYLVQVTGVKTGLNLRTSPVNAVNTILLMPPGAVAEVLAEDCGKGFARVRYHGTMGYCTRKPYLVRIDANE